MALKPMKDIFKDTGLLILIGLSIVFRIKNPFAMSANGLYT